MALLNIAVGPVSLPFRDVMALLLGKLTSIPGEVNPTFAIILYSIRLPNMVLIALTGMALAGSGAAFQGLFRNPLADPYVIGVASGAGLGAVLAMAASWVGRSTPVTTLILAGVAVSSFATAMTSLIMLLSTEELHRAVNWMVGGFSLGGWTPVLASIPYLAVGLFFLSLLGRPLNVLQFGDDQARQLGLNVERLKITLVIAASMVAATAVSFSGIIAFVGLVVPHVVRLLWGPDYRRLIPLAILMGGAFLLGADVIARVVLAPRALPVGLVTAAVGAPFFLYLLHRAKANVGFW
jgi:iron complex transport system permease protein